MTLDVDSLAQEIRRVDGSNDLGAGALAEALMPFLSTLAPSAAPQGGLYGDYTPISVSASTTLASPSAEAAQPVAEPVEWLWYGEADGEQHISFGRWQSHESQHRYKYADIQATEHDHHAQPQGELREALTKIEEADFGLANAYSATHNDYDKDRLACERIGIQKAIKIVKASIFGAGRTAG